MSGRVPDYCVPFVGYRWWSMPRWPATLMSAYGTIWLPYQALRAHCFCHMSGDLPICPESPSPLGIDLARPHNYPCGIYAWNEWSHLIQGIPEWGPIQQNDACVVVCGTVRLWGTVYPHERGWRAEYAYPDTIALLIDQSLDHYHYMRGAVEAWPDHQRAAALAKAYGIPYQFSREVYSAYRDLETRSLRRASFQPSSGQSPAACIPRCGCPACEYARREEEDRRARARASAYAIMAPSVQYVPLPPRVPIPKRRRFPSWW